MGFVNGELDLDYVTTPGALVTRSEAKQVGSWGDNSMRFNGYIDEFRVTKGAALWTSAFTPPTGAGAVIGGTGCQINVLTTATDTALTSSAPSADVAPAFGWQALSGNKGSIYKQGTYGTVKLTAGGKATGTAANAGSRGRDASNWPWSTSAGVGIYLVAKSIEK
jgi:hypothetical protein